MDNSEQVSITAFIRTKNIEQSGCYVKFPTTAEEIRSLLKTESINDCKIENVSSESIPLLTNYIIYPKNDITIDELQYISTLIAKLTMNEFEVFSAYLEVCYNFDNITVENVMNTLENMNTLSLDKTKKTAEEIGYKWFYDTLKEVQSAKDRVLLTKDSDYINFLHFVDMLQECFVAEVCGNKICHDNDMYPTSKGIVTLDLDSFVFRKGRQVPDDMKLSDKMKPSILKQVEENKSKIAQTDNSEKYKKIEVAAIE